MNAFKIKNEERLKLEKQFIKTSFGLRARISIFIPLICLFISIIATIITAYEADGLTIESTLFLLGSIISMLVFSITLFQYLNLVKDYINSQEKE